LHGLENCWQGPFNLLTFNRLINLSKINSELDNGIKLGKAFNPKVSIVIPVYNGSDYLQEAIESALDQTYKNTEVIVINDGSTDSGETENIALSYIDRIRYFKKENGGVASALNLGVREMKGDYFSWLSHDDQYFSQKIELQINYLTDLKDKLTIIYTDFNYIDENSKFLHDYRVKHIPPEHFRPAFISGGLINGCTLLIPKKCFETCGIFNEKYRTTQDYDLWFRFSERYSFVHLPMIMVKSRIHLNQGTIKLRPIKNVEENKLYIYFILKIKHIEIKLYYNRPVPIYYLDHSMIMLKYKLFKAANVALLLSLINFWQLETGYIYEYLKKIKFVSKANLLYLFKI
jgi:glycosyltransferase involved in cell wall biosynthesis